MLTLLVLVAVALATGQEDNGGEREERRRTLTEGVALPHLWPESNMGEAMAADDSLDLLGVPELPDGEHRRREAEGEREAQPGGQVRREGRGPPTGGR